MAPPTLAPRVKPTDRKKTYADLPYLAKYTPKRTVRWPRGYLVPQADPAVVAKLRQHGLLVERLAAGATLAVEGFRVTSLRPSSSARCSAVVAWDASIGLGWSRWRRP